MFKKSPLPPGFLHSHRRKSSRSHLPGLGFFKKFSISKQGRAWEKNPFVLLIIMVLVPQPTYGLQGSLTAPCQLTRGFSALSLSRSPLALSASLPGSHYPTQKNPRRQSFFQPLFIFRANQMADNQGGSRSQQEKGRESRALLVLA